jgi:hypothetical protein
VKALENNRVISKGEFQGFNNAHEGWIQLDWPVQLYAGSKYAISVSYLANEIRYGLEMSTQVHYYTQNKHNLTLTSSDVGDVKGLVLGYSFRRG